MKKFAACFLFVILLIPTFLFAGCGNEKGQSSYSIILTYDPQTQTAKGSSTINYYNSSDNALSFLMFHLYPNAFSEGADERVCSVSNEHKTYPNGKSYGKIDILNVKSSKAEAEYEVMGEHDMLLKVNLQNQLFPDETVSVTIEFDLNLPNINHRFGYGENAVNFANFYPIACVYEEGEGFVTDPYISNGDPFYSDIASYVVSVSYPQTYKIACSGDKVKTMPNGEHLTTTISSQNVRDFAFVLSEKFKTLSGKAGKTTVEYYFYDDEDPASSLGTAVKAIETYSELFGDYPYSSFAVVQTNFVHGGMEYPRLIMISDFVKGVDYDYVIAHESAHQWWYGVVGNDEFSEAWLDESLTEYSTALFFEKHSEYGLCYEGIINGANETYKFFLQIYTKINGSVDTSMARKLSEFETEPEYVNNIYTRGTLMYDTLRRELGDRKFFNTLKAYFKEFAYKNVSTAQFVDFFSSKAGRKLEGFFDSWLSGKVRFI